jgi:hypothetical protein
MHIKPVIPDYKHICQGMMVKNIDISNGIPDIKPWDLA